MKAIILDLKQDFEPQTNTVSESISFRKFIRFVQEVSKTETSIRRDYLENAIHALTSQPGFLQIESVEEATQFEPQLKIIYDLLTPNLNNTENIVWAIAAPMSPVVFYGTDAFYAMGVDPLTGDRKMELISDEITGLSEQDKILTVYAPILQHIFNITPPYYKPLVISIKESNMGLPRYYRIDIDDRFTDVRPSQALPDLDLTAIQALLTGTGDITQLPELLPIDLFHYEGISIFTLTEITIEHTLEYIKSTQFETDKLKKEAFFIRITDSLRILTSEPLIEFGLIPLLKVNQKLAIDHNNTLPGKLLNSGFSDAYLLEVCQLLTAQFVKNPTIAFTTESSTDSKLGRFKEMLVETGIKSYTVFPVYNEFRLVGFLEAYSTEALPIDENIFAKIRPANQLISRIFQEIIDNLYSSIETVVKEKFTSVQPAVQWKFQEVAWNYLKGQSEGEFQYNEKIIFENVFPLYGAVDIRNSTLARSNAVRQDLQLQLESIIEVLEIVIQKSGLSVAEAMSFKCRKILDDVSASSGKLDELKVSEFLDSEVHPLLLLFLNNNLWTNATDPLSPDAHENEKMKGAIQSYFATIVPENGVVYQHRRKLEKSMQMINSAVNAAVESYKTQVHSLFPVYFEKFRTDGVEYDIYIGQSIEPEKEFHDEYLKSVKLWQISSMAAIARTTYQLIPQMDTPLHTTQLIFVNSNVIDISFRDDERRFDVEGAYNIRYQVIKKRIDKVQVKTTGERLTQPGKIALVYFQNKSIEGYIDYFHLLQSQDILMDDLEFLDLEELQGVTGLKAVRIGVNLKILQG